MPGKSEPRPILISIGSCVPLIQTGERVEDLVLAAEVVVDEPVGDAGLVGDVADPARVEALPGEHAHGGVEDEPALLGRGGLGGGHQVPASVGHA